MASLKERLHAGEFLLGTHIHANEPSLTELLGQCGFDYLWIDTEHAPIDYAALQMHLIAARAAGCSAIVRIPWNVPYLAKRVLDQGPDGIIFPMIRSAREAEDAIRSTRYPPAGTRSFGPIRAARYGLAPTAKYLADTDSALCRFLQIEHIDAIHTLPDILNIEGIDGLILGPCDLSGSVGMLGDIGCTEVSDMINEAIALCRRTGMPIGVSVGCCGAETVQTWRQRGVQFLSAGSEHGWLALAAQRFSSAAKAAFPA